MSNKQWLWGCLGFGSVLISSFSAFAQDETARDSVLEEVIVTAERSEARLQDTAISLAVYSGDELERRGITNVLQMVATDPSLNVGFSGGAAYISMRGVSSSNTTETGDPAVSVGVDGTFQNRHYALGAAMYDIERVEVLRGPQGTLYGRNATGGAVNIITAKPQLGDNSTGQLALELGSYDLINVDGWANLPLSENFAMRLSFASREHDGYRNNDPYPFDGDDEDTRSARIQFLYTPTENLSLWASGQYTHLGGIGASSELAGFAYPASGGREPLHVLPPGLSSDGKKFAVYGDPFLDVDVYDFRWSATYDGLPGGSSLTYLGYYNDTNYQRGQYVYSPPPAPGATHVQREYPDTWTHELRWSSAPGSQLEWQAGAYYFKEDGSLLTDQYNDFRGANETGRIQFDFPVVRSESKAIFGQATYHMSDTISFTGGLRQTWDDKSREGTFYIKPGLTGLPFTIAIDQGGKAKSDQLTWLAGVQYTPNADQMFYGKISTGYKTGGFTGQGQYGPENVTSYEIGSKSMLANNRVELNLAGFFMDYTDQQVNQFVSGDNSSGSKTTNAGQSEIYGIEASLRTLVGDGGLLDVSATYLNTEYQEFKLSAGWDPTVNLDLSGNDLPLSPKLAFRAQFEYAFENVMGGTLTPRAGITYKSSQYFLPENYPVSYQGDYSLIDLGLDYTPGGKDWLLVQLYVRNLTDETIFSNGVEFYTFNNYTFNYQPPQTWGIRFTARFD